jgi:hypothetical protein
MEKYVIKECKYHGMTDYVYVPSEKRYRCVKCRSNSVQKRREKLKKILVEYKGGKCEICNYNKCISALEFHHLESNEKEFGIACKGYTKSLEVYKKEVDKCILVCSNCHREIHEKEYNKIYNDNLSDINCGNNKISKIDKDCVLNYINNGITQKEISKIFGVSVSTLKRFLSKNNIKMNK